MQRDRGDSGVEDKQNDKSKKSKKSSRCFLVAKSPAIAFDPFADNGPCFTTAAFLKMCTKFNVHPMFLNAFARDPHFSRQFLYPKSSAEVHKVRTDDYWTRGTISIISQI